MLVSHHRGYNLFVKRANKPNLKNCESKFEKNPIGGKIQSFLKNKNIALNFTWIQVDVKGGLISYFFPLSLQSPKKVPTHYRELYPTKEIVFEPFFWNIGLHQKLSDIKLPVILWIFRETRGEEEEVIIQGSWAVKRVLWSSHGVNAA